MKGCVINVIRVSEREETYLGVKNIYHGIKKLMTFSVFSEIMEAR